MAGEEDCRFDATPWYGLTTGTASDSARTHTRVTDTGEPVFLPFRMSCFVLSNLVVTAGMLTPGLKVRPSFTPLLQKSEE